MSSKRDVLCHDEAMPLHTDWLKKLFEGAPDHRLDCDAFFDILKSTAGDMLSSELQQEFKDTSASNDGKLTYSDVRKVLAAHSLSPPPRAKLRLTPKIILVQGSVRDGCKTRECCKLVTKAFEDLHVDIEMVDLVEWDLPFVGKDGIYENEASKQFKERVKSAHGVIFASPEYHGTFTSSIKMAIENLGYPSVLVGKPCLILGVASGALGAVKTIGQLSAVLQHCGALVLPGSVSVAEVHKLWDKDSGQVVNEQLANKIRGLAQKMVDYMRVAVLPEMAMDTIRKYVEIDSFGIGNCVER